jgi:hypothetical protein
MIDRLLKEADFFFLWKRHLIAAVASGEGWLPRSYRGWSLLRRSSRGYEGREPLPQKTNSLADESAPSHHLLLSDAEKSRL